MFGDEGAGRGRRREEGDFDGDGKLVNVRSRQCMGSGVYATRQELTRIAVTANVLGADYSCFHQHPYSSKLRCKTKTCDCLARRSAVMLCVPDALPDSKGVIFFVS
jgi:hypothetical protein